MQLNIYIVYNFVLMKNDTIVSVIICFDFYENDNDVFFYSLMISNVLYSMFVFQRMIYTHFNIVV